MGFVNINEQVFCDTPTLFIKCLLQFCSLQGISLKITNIPVVYSEGQVLCLGVDYWFYTTDPPSISTSDEQEVLRLENISHGENKPEQYSHYLFMLSSFKRFFISRSYYLTSISHQFVS